MKYKLFIKNNADNYGGVDMALHEDYVCAVGDESLITQTLRRGPVSVGVTSKFKPMTIHYRNAEAALEGGRNNYVTGLVERLKARKELDQDGLKLAASILTEAVPYVFEGTRWTTCKVIGLFMGDSEEYCEVKQKIENEFKALADQLYLDVRNGEIELVFQP